MTATVIENVVRERLGLDPASLANNVLERAVEARMRVGGLFDPNLYAARLITEPAERDALAALLTVPETWFFRGSRALFDRLATVVADRVAPRSVTGPVRILSVPCSTGEEPYSLAIALHERFISPSDFAFDAIDLSRQAMSKAMAARYGAFAFREPGSDVRPIYFRPVDDAWELSLPIRDSVRFQQGNLTESTFLTTERPYDLILCRNLFIYLTVDARLRAMANIERLLTIDGRLCVTPGEADRLPPGRFVPEGPTEFGIYRRVEVGSAVQAILTRRPVNEPASVTMAPPSTPNFPPVRERTRVTLSEARLLADAGQLDEARAACEKLLKTRASDVDTLALLGVVHLAAGRLDEAFDALRKALYLVPDHLEAMSHMAGLCERRGDKTRAAALRRRLAHTTGKEDA